MTANPLSNSEMERYERNISVSWFSKESQIKLKQSSVLVVGAGGLGSPAIMYLASAGVGNLGIADFDKAGLSNLQRQIIHKENYLGKSKTESAKRFVKDINSDINVIEINEKITMENGENLLCDFDFIIDATDNAITKSVINDLCVKLKKPYTHGSVQDTNGMIFSYIPDMVKKKDESEFEDSPCYRCLIHDIDRPGNLEFSGKGVLGPVCGIIGSMQALEAIKYLSGRRDLITGKVKFFDFLNYSNQDIEFGFSRKCKFHNTKI